MNGPHHAHLNLHSSRRLAPASESPSGSARSTCSTACSRYAIHRTTVVLRRTTTTTRVHSARQCACAVRTWGSMSLCYCVSGIGAQQCGRGSARGQSTPYALLRRTRRRAPLHDRRDRPHHEGAAYHAYTLVLVVVHSTLMKKACRAACHSSHSLRGSRALSCHCARTVAMR